MTTMQRAVATPRLYQGISVDFLAAVIFLLLFAVWVHAFQYRDAFAEADLYRVLIGLLDGAVSGAGIASSLHYDNTFGFGYLAAFYHLVAPATLRDPDKLTDLINQVGFYALLIGLLCFWCAVALIHRTRAATVALVAFGLGPMILELGTSGHAVIVMFALLCAGATLLFLPLTGWAALLAALAGGGFLLAGLMTRVDIIFAFPWLVLARADTCSLRGFIASCIRRSITPAAVTVVFIMLQHLIVPDQIGSVVGEYLSNYLSLSQIVIGLIYMALGCGIATAAAGIVALLWMTWRVWPGAHGLGRGALLRDILGPASLVIPELVFFVASSGPTRHFMLTYAGFSILLAIALTGALALPRWAALGLALLLAGASQVLAEVVRVPLLAANAAASPYRPVWTGYQTASHAPVGFVWQRHDALSERRSVFSAEGNRLATPCQGRTIILTNDETAQFASRLYAGGIPVQASREGFDDIRATVEGKVILYVAKPPRWPGDAAEQILSDPAYNDYKLAQDPYSISKYDTAPIPPDRQAQFGCKRL